ncbi:hypothetical protein ABS735_17595 [Streptomyces sp. MMCC 100]|uniref:hypothetical protein n=1 Tax=Streptomyces sp. MMCC 100 TaxID=3163555 RepID=UPI00359720DE
MTTGPREHETRRRTARELYSDGAPGLEALAEERLRGKEPADVPPMTVVAGTPARVPREITDADREWTCRPPRTLGPDAG